VSGMHAYVKVVSIVSCNKIHRVEIRSSDD
jgi:hypothetical protein